METMLIIIMLAYTFWASIEIVKNLKNIYKYKKKLGKFRL